LGSGDEGRVWYGRICGVGEAGVGGDRGDREGMRGNEVWAYELSGRASRMGKEEFDAEVDRRRG
jgi:hypothetical protein